MGLERQSEYKTALGPIYRPEIPVGSRVRFSVMDARNGRLGTVTAIRINMDGRDKYWVRWDDGTEENEVPAKCLEEAEAPAKRLIRERKKSPRRRTAPRV